MIELFSFDIEMTKMNKIKTPNEQDYKDLTFFTKKLKCAPL